MKNNHLKAPDMRVLLSNGSIKELKDFWKEKPLILVFLRHLGCLTGQAQDLLDLTLAYCDIYNKK